MSRGFEVVPSDTPAVARVLRAHANAMAMRVARSVAYLRQLQPWRTGAFVAGGLVMLADAARRMLR